MMVKEDVKILLVSNSCLIEMGLQTVLGEVLDKGVGIRTARSSAEIRPVLEKENIGMLILFLCAANRDEIKNMLDIQESNPALKTLVVCSGTGDASYYRSWYQKGVLGVLDMGASLPEIKAAVATVYKGNIYAGNSLLMDLIMDTGDRAAPAPALTYRENLVMEMLVGGKSNKDIGDELGIKPSTVSTFKHTVFKKLGVKNKEELIKLAYPG